MVLRYRHQNVLRGDHGRPHFHAYYGNRAAKIEIQTGEVIKGRLPPTAARLVREWTELKREALLENWRRVQNGEPFQRIPGLDQ